MSDKVISQLLNQAGSSHVTFLECRAKGLFLVSLSTTASPYLGALVFLFRKGMNAPDVFDLRLLQCLYSPTRITRITFSWHAHTAHSPSVEPHGAGLLPWASSVSGTAKPLLAALHANNKHNESALSVCHPATLLLWRKKNGANDSLWFTAKCAHTHTQYTHRDFTPQCTADHGCKLKIKLLLAFHTPQPVVTFSNAPWEQQAAPSVGHLSVDRLLNPSIWLTNH